LLAVRNPKIKSAEKDFRYCDIHKIINKDICSYGSVLYSLIALQRNSVLMVGGNANIYIRQNFCCHFAGLSGRTKGLMSSSSYLDDLINDRQLAANTCMANTTETEEHFA